MVNRITDANQKGNYTTKLFAPNGSHYIDGTGVVWKAIQKCYWLEDGWQTPFYPSDETWKWNNPESGWSMSYNPKTQDYTLYPSTNSPLVNHSYVVGNSDYDGTMILHQDLRVGTEGFFTNMIINLTRINTDGAWFIPTNHIVFSDDKRLRHNGVITNDIIMTDGAKIYEYSPGQIPAKVFSVQFNDALADHPEDGDYDLCRYNGYIDVYIPQTTPMPPIGENQRIENVYVKAELHMHYIQLYGYEPLLPEHMSFAGIFPNSSFTYQYTSTNDYLFGFLADNKNSNLMSDAFFSYFHFGNGSEDRKFFWRHGLRSSIHFFKTYDLDLDVGSITFSTRDDVYIDNVKKPYGGQGNELIDQKTNIKWEPCFYDGNLYYIATTNTIEVTK